MFEGKRIQPFVFLRGYHLVLARSFLIGNVGVARFTGGVAGTALPFTTSLAAAAVLGAVANSAQYALTDLYHNKRIDGGKLATNAALGVAAGSIRGAFKNFAPQNLGQSIVRNLGKENSKFLPALARGLDEAVHQASLASKSTMNTMSALKDSLANSISNFPLPDLAEWYRKKMDDC